MATYKVPQDVEAEDKLIGPFSFRQFIYLVTAVIAGGLAYGLYTVAAWLVIIPIPVILFFLVLALPIKKDQPFEVYLAALVRFALKPKLRMWEPEGVVKLVEVNTKKPIESIRLKEFSGSEASKRLAYLANVVDTGGWAARGVNAPVGLSVSPLNASVVAETDLTEDIMDDNTAIVQSFDTLLENERQQQRQTMTAIMQQQGARPTPASSTVSDDYDLPTPVIAPTTVPTPAATAPVATLPTAPTQEQQAQAARQEQLSADIIRLANNNDLSISAISREANRIHGLSDGEVVVELH